VPVAQHSETAADYETGEMMWLCLATTVLVESPLDRSADDDLQKAQAAIDRLAAAPTDAGFVLHDLTQLRLRALVAQGHGDASANQEFVARFHARAAAAGFEPLVAGAVEHLHGTAVEYSHASHRGRSDSSA
jgi:adenylate cyclase